MGRVKNHIWKRPVVKHCNYTTESGRVILEKFTPEQYRVKYMEKYLPQNLKWKAEDEQLIKEASKDYIADSFDLQDPVYEELEEKMFSVAYNNSILKARRQLWRNRLEVI